MNQTAATKVTNNSNITLVLLLLFVFFFSFPLNQAIAGDAATVNVIGFSSDGSYLAVEQYGMQDGSGFAWSEILFIDVQQNSYAANPEQILGDQEETLATVRSAVFRASREKLLELKIETTQLGKRLVHHPLTDQSADPHQITFSSTDPLYGLYYESFELRLTESDSTQRCDYWPDAAIRKLRLTLTDPEKVVHVLQDDQQVPASRGCALRYRIQDVYLYQASAIAVFINLFSPGFEGENMRFLVITATLN